MSRWNIYLYKKNKQWLWQNNCLTTNRHLYQWIELFIDEVSRLSQNIFGSKFNERTLKIITENILQQFLWSVQKCSYTVINIWKIAKISINKFWIMTIINFCPQKRGWRADQLHDDPNLIMTSNSRLIYQYRCHISLKNSFKVNWCKMHFMQF